jgi:hypothetical protein
MMHKNFSTRIIFESVKSKRINSSLMSLREGGEGGRVVEREWVRNC